MDEEHNELQDYKCGEIYVSKTSVYIFVCWYCKKEFDNFISFQNHTEISHRKSIEVNEIDDELIYTVKIEPENLVEANEEYKFHEQILIEKYEASIGKESEDSFENSWFDEDVYILENETNIDIENDERTLVVKSRNKTSEINLKLLKQEVSTEKNVLLNTYNTAYEIFIDPKQNIKAHPDNIDIPKTDILCDKEKIKTDKVNIIHDRNNTNLDYIKSQDSEKNQEQTKKESHPSIDINKRLQCRFCEKKFKLQTHLQKHELNHQNLKCRFCGRNFKRPILLKNHVRTHTGEKPFQCSQCPAAFALKRNLNTHFIYKHTEDKPFQCRYEGGCGKCFKTDQLRNFHEKRHSQNVEFQCEICGAEFNVKEKLKMHHKKKHMDYSERPHKCSYCDKKFVIKFHLREHERTHTGEKPLKCNQCSSSFAKKSSLREHKKLHSGEKKHVCKICGKAFAQLAGYSNHMKNHP